MRQVRLDIGIRLQVLLEGRDDVARGAWIYELPVIAEPDAVSAISLGCAVVVGEGKAPW